MSHAPCPISLVPYPLSEEKSQKHQVVTASKSSKPLLILGFPIAVIVQAISGSESEAMLGIVDDTEEKSQKDQVVTASKSSKPLLT